MKMSNLINPVKDWARKLRSEMLVLYRVSKDPDTPWFVKAFIVCVVAYAFSPIDLIPDFIPVIGHLDDVILIPLGIYLALKIIPPDVLEKCREEIQKPLEIKPKIRWVVALIIIFIWVGLIAVLIYKVTPLF
jgi:uncharacterized membrane protein YkvA (DUF1232 family)